MQKSRSLWSLKTTLLMTVVSISVTFMIFTINVHAAGNPQKPVENAEEISEDDPEQEGSEDPELLPSEEHEPADRSRPTLNASVSEGILRIRAYDKESAIKVIYVNGYEYMDPIEGKVAIRLTQFDAGYEYFEITAMDEAGNMSAVYRTRNPYYRDPESDDDEDPAAELPESAEPTDPSDAQAIVIDHYNSDPDAVYGGREFYTIAAESGKAFYLIIDRTGDEEVVYFLTEITENDLLNVTSDNSQTLPRNSAVADSQIPVTDVGIPAGSSNDKNDRFETEEGTEDRESSGAAEKISEAVENDKSNPMMLYIIMAVVGGAAIGAGYYFKVVKPKKDGNFVEDEDDEDEEDYDDEKPVSEEDDYMPPIEDAADTIGDDTDSDPDKG